MTALGIIVAVIAVAFVAWLAYCEDVRSREIENQDAAGDCLTPADLARMGIVNPDFTAGWIETAANPYWQNRIDSAATGRDQCGGPSEQPDATCVPVGNGSHPVNGLPRGGGLGVRVAPEPGATYSCRASGEAAGHD